MSWEAFAAKRSERLNDFDDEIRPIVARELENWGSDAWYNEIVEAASVLWLEIWEKHGGGDYGPQLEVYTREMRETLAKTTEPADPPTDAQIDRVARWIGVYTVNHATFHASVQTGQLEKTWIDMDDDAVRATHRAAAGQTVPIGAAFRVGDFRLHFPGEPVGPPEIWINCRCLLGVTGGEDEMGNRRGTSFASTDVEDEVDEDEVELTDEQLENEDLLDDPIDVPWHGVLAIEGKETGDRRKFAEDAIVWDGMVPFVIDYQRLSGEGHSGAVAVMRCDRVERVPVGGGVNEIRGWGMINNAVAEADEVIDGLAFGTLGGVSIDIDSSEFEFIADESEDSEDGLFDLFFGSGTTLFTSARLRKATLVAMPAFAEAYIALGEDFDAELADPGEETPREELEDALVASGTFAPGTKDGPGWLTNPRATQRLRSYWVKGAGAAKIRWGAPGDFDRCRRQLAKYVNPAFLAGTCANLHKEATGTWPGVQRGDKHSIEDAAPAFVLVASAAVADVLPHEWFEDPKFTQLTGLTITDEGRIFGHLAAWGTCHIGYDQICVTPPRSISGYASYRVGLVETDAGPVSTGVLTMATEHAGLRPSAGDATRFYANTGNGVADIAVGEDTFGIWFSGALRPDLTDDEIRVLRASPPSGDWRYVNGQPEMVGVLSVNSPGYPVPRGAKFAVEDGHQLSLVAAGVLVPKARQRSTAFGAISSSPEDLLAIGRVVADELEYRQDRRERLSNVKDPELIEAAEARRAARLVAAKSLE